jgi:DNA-binding XRE family transcriptional regulator
VSEHSKAWRLFRAENLLSQQAFADAVGVTKRTVQYIEGGDHEPGYTSQRRFLELQKRYREASEVEEDEIGE